MIAHIEFDSLLATLTKHRKDNRMNTASKTKMRKEEKIRKAVAGMRKGESIVKAAIEKTKKQLNGKNK